MSIDILVNQSVPQSYGDGTPGTLRTNRRGELIIPAHGFQLVQEGRMYQVSNAAKSTALAAGGNSYSDTAPAFSCDIATGTTMIPRRIMLNQGGTLAGGVITVLITWDDKTTARYSSGGAALTSRSMRRDAPNSSNITWYANATLGALNSHNLIYAAILKNDVMTAPSAFGQSIDLNESNEVFPALVGPAQLVIYTFAATVQPSWFYKFVWAEYSPSQVI